MTREEAVNRFKGIRESFSISIAQSKFYPSKVILNELCDMAIEALQAPTGEWIEQYASKERTAKLAVCSECGWYDGYKVNNYNYCPNCGAKMGR